MTRAYEVKENPPSFIELTRPYPLRELQFAITQLERSRKSYYIEYLDDGRCVIWARGQARRG